MCYLDFSIFTNFTACRSGRLCAKQKAVKSQNLAPLSFSNTQSLQPVIVNFTVHKSFPIRTVSPMRTVFNGENLIMLRSIPCLPQTLQRSRCCRRLILIF